MVEWFSSQRRVQEAHKLIEQMRERGIVLSPYVDAEMVRETYAAGGAHLQARAPAGRLHQVGCRALPRRRPRRLDL